MNRAYKYRLYPNASQEKDLVQITGSIRWLWNYMLDLNIKTHDQTKKFVFAYDMNFLLPDLKTQNPWLKNSPSQSLQQKCIDLDMALKRVWKSGSGFPKFKSKNKAKDSFRIPQQNNHIKLTDTHIQIQKLDW